MDRENNPEPVPGFAQRFEEALSDAGYFERKNAKGKQHTATSLNKLIAKDLGGYSYRQIEFLRNGERHPSMAITVKIASLLNVNIEWLVLGKGQKRPPTLEDQELLIKIQNLSSKEREALKVFLPSDRKPKHTTKQELENNRLLEALRDLSPDKREVIELILNKPALTAQQQAQARENSQ